MHNEENIVKRVQTGDAEAFSELYEEYFDKVYRYVVLKVGRGADAEDITQQAFIKAFEAIPGFKWKGLPFSSWLFRIAHNQVVDWHRRRGKMTTTQLEETSAISNGLEDSIEQKLAVEQVVRAAGGLTKAQREALSLRFGAEMSIAEVAKTMGKTEGAIKALQHSAVVSLRKVLAEEDND